MNLRVAHIDTGVIHGVEPGTGITLCAIPFVWDSDAGWKVRTARERGYVVANRRAPEAAVTCMQCCAKERIR